MKLILHAQVSAGLPAFEYQVTGEVLAVNGEVFDLSPLGEGDLLPRAAFLDGRGEVLPFIAGAAQRLGGEIVVPVVRWVPAGHPALNSVPEELRLTDGRMVLDAA